MKRRPPGSQTLASLAFDSSVDNAGGKGALRRAENCAAFLDGAVPACARVLPRCGRGASLETVIETNSVPLLLAAALGLMDLLRETARTL